MYILKSNIKNKKTDEKHLNGVLLNILSISITFFLTIGSSIYFLGKLENRVVTNENEINNLKSDVENFKNHENGIIIDFFNLNNKIIDNKIYIYETYKDKEERDRLLKIVDDNFNKEIKSIMTEKPTK